MKILLLVCTSVLLVSCSRHGYDLLDLSSVENNSTILIEKLTVNNVSSDSFKVSTQFVGDQNSNSSVVLSYCNLTDSPACTPSTVLGNLTKGIGNFYLNITSTNLTGGDNPGDKLRLRVTSDGRELEYVVTLADSTVNHIYRSVGPGNTSALAVGTTNSLIIAGSTAQFQNPIPDNVGVGDAIQYDSTGDSSIDSIAFIHERLDSTTYVVKTATGSTPNVTGGDNDWSLFRAFTSLSDAEAGNENTGIDPAVRSFDTWSGGADLVALDLIWNFAFYGDAADTAQATFISWTTSSENYIKVFAPSAISEVGVSQRHEGVWDNTKARMSVTNSYGIYILDDYVVIDGLQVELISTGTDANKRGIRSNVSQSVNILNNIVKGTISSTGNYNGGISLYSGTIGSESIVANNIIYGFDTAPNSAGIFMSGSGDFYVYNNTVYGAFDCYYGIANSVYKNNIAQNCTNTGFRGATHADSTNNLSLLADAPGSNPINSTTLTFVDTVGHDYALSATDTAAIATGMNLLLDSVFPFNFDMLNRQRDADWDLGALKN